MKFLERKVKEISADVECAMKERYIDQLKQDVKLINARLDENSKAIMDIRDMYNDIRTDLIEFLERIHILEEELTNLNSR